MKVSFKGPLKKVLGISDFQLEDGNLNDILESISHRLGISFEIRDQRLYMHVGDIKFTVSMLYNGVNVLRKEVKVLKGGKLEIITPFGGG